jgi:hypothetical protein
MVMWIKLCFYCFIDAELCDKTTVSFVFLTNLPLGQNIPLNAENKILLANIVTTIKMKSPPAMHRSTINSNTI